MAKDVNKVFLLGNVGSDPVTSVTKKGTLISTFSLATSDIIKTENGEYQKQTLWHNVKLFGNAADVASKYVKKGTRIFVEGKVSYKIMRNNKNSYVTTYTNVIGKGIILLENSKKKYIQTEIDDEKPL